MTLAPCRWPPSVGPRASSLVGFRATCAAVLFLGTAACGFGREATPDEATQEYARAVAEAQAELDGGRAEEARRRLEATDKSLRGFEYDYLRARAQAAEAGKAAPDLVRTVALPKVEARYGVLNEVDRQLVFICRDGSLRAHDLSAPDAPPKTASAVVLTLKRPDHTAKPAVSRDGRLLGWSEPGGYRFIDLGKRPDGGR
jgi:hypothetical protein